MSPGRDQNVLDWFNGLYVISKKKKRSNNNKSAFVG
jgi:hypothetical protein